MFHYRLPMFTFLSLIFFFFVNHLFTSAANLHPHEEISSCKFSDNKLVMPKHFSPVQLVKSSTPPTPKTLVAKAFSRTNRIASYVIFLITILNIIVYKINQVHEEEYHEKHTQSSSRRHQFRLFSVREIQSATNDFDEELVLGRGGFGKVYKGLIDDGTKTVAMKRLNSTSRQGAKEFRTEIDMFSKFRHSHLLALIGYCDDDQEMILVYEYMPHGTLSDQLYKRRRTGNLSWEQRLKICIGAARGLDYLHTGTGVKHRVIHRDVKSSNILLDEFWEAKISDFGLSKIGPANQSCSHVITNVKGTFGYLDPEYFLTHRLTRKSDVYAFGVVLFEVLCGRPAVDVRLDDDQQSLAQCARRCVKEKTLDTIIDPSLRGQLSQVCLEVFAEIAYKCLQNDPDQRPTMADVVARLEFALASQNGIELSLDYELPIAANVVIVNQDNSDSPKDDIEVSPDESGRFSKKLANENVPVSNTRANEIVKVGNTSEISGQPGMLNLVTRKMFKAISVMTKGKNVWRKKKKNGEPFHLKSTNTKPYPSHSSSAEIHLKSTNTKPYPSHSSSVEKISIGQFSIHEIQDAINFFDACILARGHYGTVFMGFIDDSDVAIKYLTSNSKKFGYESFCKEIALPRMINHLNVLPLTGFCCNDDYTLSLVSKYMCNRSLHDHLHDTYKSPIPWIQRLKICIGVAKGLNYLHTCIAEQPIVHGNVRPTKILLDENWIPKVSGFDMSKLGTSVIRNSDSSQERCAHMDPVYVQSRRLTTKTDVYSMGVVLLQVVFVWEEIIKAMMRMSGYQVILSTWVRDRIREKTLHQFIDPSLVNKVAPECFSEFIDIALNCLQVEDKNRPSMEELVYRLKFALKLQTKQSVGSFDDDDDDETSFASFGSESAIFPR